MRNVGRRENIQQPLSGSGRTYRDKVDNTIVVGNILMNVHGEWGAHHGLQKEAMFHDVRVRALLSLLE